MSTTIHSLHELTRRLQCCLVSSPCYCSPLLSLFTVRTFWHRLSHLVDGSSYIAPPLAHHSHPRNPMASFPHGVFNVPWPSCRVLCSSALSLSIKVALPLFPWYRITCNLRSHSPELVTWRGDLISLIKSIYMTWTYSPSPFGLSTTLPDVGSGNAGSLLSFQTHT